MGLRYDGARAMGNFVHAETGTVFEYDELDQSAAYFEHDKDIGATHVVFVGPWSRPWKNVDRGTRAAIVKKTVAYVAVDEDDMGRPVWEKWRVKNHNVYAERGE